MHESSDEHHGACPVGIAHDLLFDLTDIEASVLIHGSHQDIGIHSNYILKVSPGGIQAGLYIRVDLPELCFQVDLSARVMANQVPLAVHRDLP